MDGKFTTTKTGIFLWHFHSQSLTSRNKHFSWAPHVDDRSESSSTNDMIIGNQPSSSWRIRHNHELQ
jgi:hypothetical protein